MALLKDELHKLLEEAKGLPEPTQDADLNIINWPLHFKNHLHQVFHQLRSCDDTKELFEAGCSFNSHDLTEIPEAVVDLLSKALYDNSATPTREIIEFLNQHRPAPESKEGK
ncbi:MAG: hypothetical protein JO317_06060 [Verrucomicrobiae bacterium]|nr:hypothetical protein [Verrucomicrobiae bacterium]